tara:strand:+ start:436 stop:561 length:126 start_codon:yes stop_codon:yes gene_type:complete
MQQVNNKNQKKIKSMIVVFKLKKKIENLSLKLKFQIESNID